MQVHATSTYPLTLAQPTVNGYDVIKVESDSTPGKFYTVDVTMGRCSCPGWTKRKPNAYGIRQTCKHLRMFGFVQVPNPTELNEPTKPVQSIAQKVKA